MCYKKIFILLLILLLFSGCAQTSSHPEPAVPPVNQIPPPEQNPSGPPTKSVPASPITIDLSFPSGAPALNQIAEFKVIAMANMYTTDIHFETILPEGFELVSGNLTWSTNRLSHEPTEVINARIKAIKIGNWTLETRATMGPNAVWEFAEGGGKYPIYVAVNENSAEWGEYPPWSKKDGFDIPVKKVESPSSPIKVKLSISKAPR